VIRSDQDQGQEGNWWSEEIKIRAKGEWVIKSDHDQDQEGIGDQKWSRSGPRWELVIRSDQDQDQEGNWWSEMIRAKRGIGDQKPLILIWREIVEEQTLNSHFLFAGIVNPIQAEQHVQGVGLGSSGSKIDANASWKDRNRAAAIERFRNIREWWSKGIDYALFNDLLEKTFCCVFDVLCSTKNESSVC
jgi:hypothetical protein